MKKIIILSLCMMICILGFTSCKKNKPNVDGDVPSGGNGETLHLIFSEEIKWDAGDIMSDVLNKSNCGSVVLMPPSTEKTQNEIIIGNADREVSRKAYQMLERIDAGEKETKWLLYAYEGSVCLAFDKKVGCELGAEYLVSEVLSKSTLPETNGIIASDTENYYELAETVRASERAAAFDAMVDTLGEETVEELKKLYSIVDADTYVWLANLFCPEVGGFYYSNSARNNYPFLPDLESTNQATKLVVNSGLFDGYEEFPEDIREMIVSFAQGLQSSEDGYFYHPQWGTAISIAKRARDLGNGTGILKRFGAGPLYNTSNGIPGSLGAPGVSGVSYMVSPLQRSAVTAVSSVVAVVTPSYLQSIAAFEEFLLSLNINQNSYSAGNTIAMMSGEIKSAGPEYVDFAVEFLNSTQNPENGTWGSTVSFGSVNGLFKILSAYEGMGRQMPNYEQAFDSAMEVAFVEDMETYGKTNNFICSVYNPIDVLVSIIENVKQYEGDEAAERMRAKVIERSAELVRITFNKIYPFKRDGGGFSYFPYGPSTTQQGSIISLANTLESDVNGTSLTLSGAIGRLFPLLGVTQPDYFCDIDGEIFYEILDDLGSIIKNEAASGNTEPVTFDDMTPEEAAELRDLTGSIDNPADGVQTLLGTDEYYKWFTSDIVQNPDPKSEPGDYVLKANTYLAYNDDGSVVVPKNPSGTRFTLGVLNNAGNRYVFDADIMLANTIQPKSDKTVAEIVFTNIISKPTSTFLLKTYEAGGETYIQLVGKFNGADGVSKVLASKIPLGEWFNIRIEVYKVFDSDGKLSVHSKIYLNGEYKGESDCGYMENDNTVYADRTVDHVRIAWYRHSESEFYVNNVMAIKDNEKFVSDDPSNDLSPDRIANFEDGKLNTEYLTNVLPSDLSYSIVDDPTGASNKVLMVVKEATDVKDNTFVTISNENPAGNCYVFESRMYYTTDLVSKVPMQIFIQGGDSTAKYTTINKFNIYYNTELGQFCIQQANTGTGGSGNGYILDANGETSYTGGLGTWITWRFEFYYDGTGDTAITKFFAAIGDGEMEFVGEAETYNATTALAFDYVNRIRLCHQAPDGSTLYLDDISFTRIDKAYVVTPVEPDTDDGTEPDTGDGTEPDTGDGTEPDTGNGNEPDTGDGTEPDTGDGTEPDTGDGTEPDTGDGNEGGSGSDGGNTGGDDTTEPVEKNPATFEDGNIDSEFLKNETVGDVKYDVVDDPTGAANKVLQVVNGAAKDKDNTYVYISNQKEAGNCYVFEARMYYTDVTKTTPMQILIQGGKETTNYSTINKFNLYYNTDLGKFCIQQANTGTGGSGNGYILDANGETSYTGGLGTWITWRFEFYYDGTGDTAITKFFAAIGDGEMEFVGEAETYQASTVLSYPCVNRVRLFHYQEISSTLYLDDVSFYRIDKAYVVTPVEPDTGDGTEPDTGDGTEPDTGDGTEPDTGDGTEPDTGDGTEPDTGDGNEPDTGDGTEPDTGDGTEPDTGDGTEPDTGDGNEGGSGSDGGNTGGDDTTEPVEKNPATFEDGNKDTEHLTNPVSSDLDFSVIEDPTDSSNKVLMVVKESTDTKNNTILTISNENPAGDCYVLEARMYYTGELTSKIPMQIFIRGGADASAATAINKFNIYYDSTVGKFCIQQANTGTNGSGNGFILDANKDTSYTGGLGEWISWRIEFYYGGKKETTITKFYAAIGDGEMEFIGEAATYNATSALAYDYVNSVRLCHQGAHNFTLYLDDVSFIRIDKAYVVTPVEPDTDGGTTEGVEETV